jgi:hypothetical protein
MRIIALGDRDPAHLTTVLVAGATTPGRTM